LNLERFPRSVSFWFVVVGGCLVIGIYIAFTGVSIGMFPEPFSPMFNWMSDLGNVMYNPGGAIFFNLGCVLTSVVLVVFFMGYSYWNLMSRNKNLLLVTCKAFGFFDAFTLAMLGIFNENMVAMHDLFSVMFFYGNMGFMIVTSITLLFHSRSLKGVSLYGFLVAGVSMAFLVMPLAPRVIEWVIVIASLGFVALMVVNTIFSVNKIT